MDDLNKLTELHAAYLCLKDTPADDLLSYSELKHAFQYAGFNPSTEFLKSIWVEGETQSISFNEFYSHTQKLQMLDEDEIRKIISNVFIVNGDSIQVSDLKSLLSMVKRKSSISEYDIDSLVDEVGEMNGSIKVSNICKLINGTIKNLKNIALKDLEEKSLDQRISKRTFTKKEIALKLQNSGHSIDVQDWFSTSLKGSLFIDEDLIISHQYSLEISCMGPTVIKILPLKFTSNVLTVDILAYIFRETADGNKNLIGYTNLKSEDGSNYWIDTLKEGKYAVIPYTTGCIKKKAKNEKHVLQVLKKQEKVELTTECTRILEDIFYQMDLDGNGFLNRQEFNLYNWRTSGETVQDDEWDIVLNNFDVENGEVTLKGFLSLHQLEAEDNGPDSEDLWLSLETMGYNKYGNQERCCPFSLSVYSQAIDPILLVSGLKSGGMLLDKAVIRSVIEESEPLSICDRSDLIKYVLLKEQRACIVVQNKSTKKITLKVDCSESVNCFSNRETLTWIGDIDEKSAIIAHHLCAISSQKPWSVNSKETIIE